MQKFEYLFIDTQTFAYFVVTKQIDGWEKNTHLRNDKIY